jgi:hypothetical protein
MQPRGTAAHRRDRTTGGCAGDPGPHRPGSANRRPATIALPAPVDEAVAANDGAPIADPAASEPPPPPAVPRVYATGDKGLLKIYERPDRDARVIGAVRAGQGVRITDTTMTAERREARLYKCNDGWYPVAPRGFVCVGGEGHGTLDANDARVMGAAEALPDLSKDYPFHFGVSVGAPFYKRIPTADEQRQVEGDVAAYRAKLPTPSDEGAVDLTPAGRPPSERLLSYIEKTKPELTDSKDAYEGYKVSWTQEFDANGRTWLLTPDMAFLPKDKVRVKEKLPTLQGVNLKATGQSLPMAFVWVKDIETFMKKPEEPSNLPSWAIKKKERMDLIPTGDTIKRHSFVKVTGKMAMGPGGVYHELEDASWVKYSDVTVFNKAQHTPPGIGATDKWVDIRVTWGTLVAYEGETPVYITAMSPGIDGVKKKAHATKRGRYQIGWKMLSADMDGRDRGKNWYVDEVPWVQYYKDSFALHGAWWHNDFGRAKSHGCINLSPPDARHLFGWMDPPMPEGWYAVTSFYPVLKGTLVRLRT